MGVAQSSADSMRSFITRCMMEYFPGQNEGGQEPTEGGGAVSEGVARSAPGGGAATPRGQAPSRERANHERGGSGQTAQVGGECYTQNLLYPMLFWNMVIVVDEQCPS